MFRLNYKFFVNLSAVILCLVAPFIHKAGFDGTQYFSQNAFIIPLIGAIVVLLLSAVMIVNRYAPVLMFLVSLTSLLAFVNVSYLYLSSVFFNGMADTIPGMLEQIGFQYSFCAFAYVGAMLISIVGMFLPDVD